ncbi:hypothetical protein [Glutamicibacter sp. FBE19]|uniref:hypothetical protein n=1 Tax=Glutamicibacter sp. FBE19 TaxID=2761534 RepID=UPI0019D5AF40|nr:hypothetical protein [Glutamicibacter sp. FBE19]MBF6671177.1 hypothetical protein [Glutamicibacter sp. FBE19]
MRQAKSRFLASLYLLIAGIAVSKYSMIRASNTDPASPEDIEAWRVQCLLTAAVACVLLPWCIKSFMEFREQIRNNDKEMDFQ